MDVTVMVGPWPTLFLVKPWGMGPLISQMTVYCQDHSTVLHCHMCLWGMKPFPSRETSCVSFPGCNLSREKLIFNYHLSRARLIVERAFGMLTRQWRMYSQLLTVNPAKAEVCVKTTCILHNFIRMSRRGTRNQLCVILPERGASSTPGGSKHGKQYCTCWHSHLGCILCLFLCISEGAVPWQYLVL